MNADGSNLREVTGGSLSEARRAGRRTAAGSLFRARALATSRSGSSPPEAVRYPCFAPDDLLRCSRLVVERPLDRVQLHARLPEARPRPCRRAHRSRGHPRQWSDNGGGRRVDAGFEDVAVHPSQGLPAGRRLFDLGDWSPVAACCGRRERALRVARRETVGVRAERPPMDRAAQRRRSAWRHLRHHCRSRSRLGQPLALRCGRHDGRRPEVSGWASVRKCHPTRCGIA
jgi:hypothetical protein